MNCPVLNDDVWSVIKSFAFMTPENYALDQTKKQLKKINRLKDDWESLTYLDLDEVIITKPNRPDIYDLDHYDNCMDERTIKEIKFSIYKTYTILTNPRFSPRARKNLIHIGYYLFGETASFAEPNMYIRYQMKEELKRYCYDEDGIQEEIPCLKWNSNPHILRWDHDEGRHYYPEERPDEKLSDLD